MKSNFKELLGRAHRNERGQVLVMVALMLVGLLAMSAFVIDMGVIYFSYRQLQAATDAAALAGATQIPNGTAVTAVNQYSGSRAAGAVYNIYPNLTITSVNVQLACVTSTIYQLPPCIIYGSQPSTNALKVLETATVPLTFATVVGWSSMPITAVSVAAASGGPSAPFNVAIVLDSTPSMNNRDPGGLCGSLTMEQCALQGSQILLQTMIPCAGGAACTAGATGQVKNPVDEVSYFTFPAVTAASTPADYCQGGAPVWAPYPLPAIGVIPAYDPTYQIVGFSSDFRMSNLSTTLNTSSHLALASGATSPACNGIQVTGQGRGYVTYYAGAIYSAEYLLLQEQSARPNTQNALIILGDGASNSPQSNMASNATNSGTYPSYVSECHQAVTAAQWAALQGVGGTRVYSIAYDALTTGCTTDTSPYNSPCYTMQHIASTSNYFYTDASSNRNGCNSTNNQTITSLNQIFQSITQSLSLARLIPRSAWPNT